MPFGDAVREAKETAEGLLPQSWGLSQRGKGDCRGSSSTELRMRLEVLDGEGGAYGSGLCCPD